MEKSTIFYTPRYQSAINEYLFFLKADVFLTAIYTSLCSAFLLLKQHYLVTWQQLAMEEVAEPPMCRKVIYVNIHITCVLQQKVPLQHV